MFIILNCAESMTDSIITHPPSVWPKSHKADQAVSRHATRMTGDFLATQAWIKSVENRIKKLIVLLLAFLFYY